MFVRATAACGGAAVRGVAQPSVVCRVASRSVARRFASSAAEQAVGAGTSVLRPRAVAPLRGSSVLGASGLRSGLGGWNNARTGAAAGSRLDEHLQASMDVRRSIHMSRAPENLPLIIGISVAGVAMVAKYAVQAYPAWKEKREKTQAAFRSPYKGGFEEEMTRREAALILGVRESASKERIKKRHRELLIRNHPDKGGSTFVATKINEAKDKLLGG